MKLDESPGSYYVTFWLSNAMVMNTHGTANLDRTLAALAHPTRRAILARLASGEESVNEIAARFSISQPAVSKHLKVLERAGLITRQRDAQRRPCRLRAEPLEEVADWVEGYRRFWEGSLDRLGRYLKKVQKDGGRG
jgi:DNA-binding transcriptional ArsR family regulator